MIDFKNEWNDILESEFKKEYYHKLRKFLVHEYSSCNVYPKMYDIYNAMKLTSYNFVKVVLLGQDPYHGENQAHGLCFSVKRGNPIPPSLKNIFKELSQSTEVKIPNHGDLTKWANEGVLLLNSVLTVRRGLPNSHRSMGWEIFTDKIISSLNERTKPVIFIFWGKNALSKERLITNKRHFILKAAHPSPLSANNGFFGCNHFSIVNKILKFVDEKLIDWNT